MLREIPASLLQEWRAYDEVEPFGPLREDYRAASIVQAHWNIARDTKKHPNGWPVEEFLLQFGDHQRIVEPQSVAFQETLIDAWCKTNNAIVAAQEARAQ